MITIKKIIKKIDKNNTVQRKFSVKMVFKSNPDKQELTVKPLKGGVLKGLYSDSYKSDDLDDIARAKNEIINYYKQLPKSLKDNSVSIDIQLR